MRFVNLDMDVLRTLVAGRELGSFHRAAAEVGRSQSAVSQQLRRIEAQIGERLFKKHGRLLVPTEAGDVVLAYARRILALNDEAMIAVRGRALEGRVRFGLPADLAESFLPGALGRFKRAHPLVRVEAVVDRNRRLLSQLDAGELDLAVTLGNGARPDAQRIATLPFVWIGPRSLASIRGSREPLPLAVFEDPCFFRRAALAALERAGIRWRIAFVSPSLHGIWAAVEAGIGITLRTPVGLPATLSIATRAGLPRPPIASLPVCLHDGGRAPGPVAEQLRAIVVDEVARQLRVSRGAGSWRSPSSRRRA
jgi:DNA-binding transcriptional LysR family regulator